MVVNSKGTSGKAAEYGELELDNQLLAVGDEERVGRGLENPDNEKELFCTPASLHSICADISLLTLIEVGETYSNDSHPTKLK